MKTQKKAWLSALASIVLMAVIGLFAFTSEKGNHKINQKGTTVYFEYSGTTYTEIAYRNPANWTYTTSPSDCPGEGHICVLQIDDSNLTGSGTMVDKLDQYFQSLSTNDVKAFVETPANIAYEKL
ncbi:MAG: hypothetical protein P0Y49_13795 [Candidatus Pedobacter colombiensis]|uniref:Uncharacterized protein n=1 Tax=Candidatus Pedobacter colombiensis TaxID=3121371 RepID=A0AAJ5W4L3_9SPHI|nr:hypothetical protein [Pedobacter sp.]WEK17872.1 MAG: hypothetical protein P0Y49_13795 [Pedobacter sp.]